MNITEVYDVSDIRMLKVVWQDAMFISGQMESLDEWLDTIKEKGRIICPRTFLIGFLVGEDNDNLYLAKELWETRQFKYLHAIPKRMIIEIIELEEKRED